VTPVVAVTEPVSGRGVTSGAIVRLLPGGAPVSRSSKVDPRSAGDGWLGHGMQYVARLQQ
jgi:hypothetical protein